jgi:hypothetical protein
MNLIEVYNSIDDFKQIYPKYKYPDSKTVHIYRTYCIEIVSCYMSLIKIGETSNPRQRIDTISYALNKKGVAYLSRIVLLKSELVSEKTLHLKLNHYRFCTKQNGIIRTHSYISKFIGGFAGDTELFSLPFSKLITFLNEF